ncbi:MAG TPA: phage baseplate assembly protein V [Thermoanaerobaculia bacterium]|nr:phage baseplate assembly protein V [Thermoanaerobaculia bacterium]
MESFLTDLVDTLSGQRDKLYGVMVGKVINLLDPLALGRVQVQLPSIDSLDLSPWARVAVPMAGIAHGFYFIPNLNDEVLVAFEHGDVNAPYILGSLWNAMAPPPMPSPLPQIRMIRTLAGNTIMFTEVPPTITIQTASMQTVVMSPAGIQIQTGASIINMTPDGVTITGTPNLNLVASTAINIAAPNVTINGATAASVLSAGAVNVTAPMVKIN